MDNSIFRSIKFEKFDCESVVPNYDCSYCGFIANLWITLREHVLNHHEGLQNCRRSGFIIEKYSCKNCDFTSFSSLVVVAHKRKCTFLMKHKGTIYGCEDSDRKTKGKHQYNLLAHNIRRHRDAANTLWFQCDKCEYKAKTKRNLCEHIKRVHIPKNGKCSYCPFITSWSASLIRHIATYHADPEKINWLKCDKCEYKAKSKYLLIHHINRKHARGNLPHYECSQCSYKTSDRQSIRGHMISRHTNAEDIKWFKCNKCEYKAKDKRSLKRHVNVRHPLEDQPYYECGQCSFKTIYTWRLKKHIFVHHTDPEQINWFKCEQCEYKTKFKYCLTKHINSKHARENLPHYECSQCSFKTTEKRSLKRHVIARHTKAEDIEWFKCNKCEYRAKEKGNLKKHVDIRHPREDLPHYECSQCYFRTTVEWVLSRHVIKSHTRPNEIKWFKCDQCEYKAKEKSYLTRHVIKKHTLENLIKDKCKPVAIFGSIKFEKFDCESVLPNYKCTYCGYATDLWITLREHVCNHHVGFQNRRRSEFNIENYFCENCDFRSYSSLVTLAHKMKHKVSEEIILHGYEETDCGTKRTPRRKDIFYHQCSYCSFKTVHQKYLRIHNIRHHTDSTENTWFQCHECEFKTKAKHNFDTHIKKIHHKCSECSFTTTCKTSLKRHVIARHTDPKEINWFLCGQCEFKAKVKHNLDAHIKQIHLREEHKCSYCSFSTTHPRNLRRHIAIRHSDPEEIKWFSCSECEFKAKARRNLKAHVNRIHLRVDHKCSECPFATTCSSNLKRHIIAHHTDPEEINWFLCGQCEFKAKVKHNLDAHIKQIHLREDHKCSYCPFITTYPRNLRRHIIAHHTDPEVIN